MSEDEKLEERLGGHVIAKRGPAPPGAQTVFEIDVVETGEEQDGQTMVTLTVNGKPMGPPFPHSPGASEFLVNWFTGYMAQRVEEQVAALMMEKPEGSA